MSIKVFGPLEDALTAALSDRRWIVDPYDVRNAKTPNMQLAQLVAGWAWSIRNAPKLEPARRAKLQAYIDQQRTLGLQCITDRPREIRWHNEQMTASHHGTWSHWVWAVIVLCRRLQRAELSGLLGSCEWWVGGHIAVWSLVDRNRTGTLAIAGARCGQDGDNDHGGKGGVDLDGPRNPVHVTRNQEWRAVLASIGQWKRRVPKIGTGPLAIREGWRPRLDYPLPKLAEPMVVRWHGDGSTSTSCEVSPGQGGAQHVLQLSDGSWRVLEAERTDDVVMEWWAA